MVYIKPQVTIKQEYAQTADAASQYLPSMIVGARYNVHEKSFLAQYTGEELVLTYPGQELLSEVDTAYNKLYFRNANLKYYDSLTEVHTWRKIGVYTNQIRALKAYNLTFKSNTGYPHSAIFNDRDVQIGDKVQITKGTSITESEVTGFVADQSSASIDAAQAYTSNKTSQANNIGAAVSGPSQPDASAVSNIAGTYTGSLYYNVLSDTYTVKIINPGSNPDLQVLETNTASDNVCGLNAKYDSIVYEKYTIRIVTGGALGTATYVIESQSGQDNTAETLTALSGVLSNLNSHGSKFSLTGTTALSANDTFVISAYPSEARLQITTTSGKDQVSSRVFPGYDYEFAVGLFGAKLTISAVGGATIVPLNYYWTIPCTKEVTAVTATKSGTFTGPVDINYFLEVVQGGEWGRCIVRVTSTYTDSHTNLVLDHALFIVGLYGLQLAFSDGPQGGLIQGDKYSIKCYASQNTAYQTLQIKDSLIEDTTVIAAATYSGAGVIHNTATSSGTYLPSNSALDWYNTEIYTVVISKLGAYGVAEFTVLSSSGLDSNSTPTIIAAAATPYAVGTKGAYITFSGVAAFALVDRWTISVSKDNVSVKLCIPIIEIPVTEDWSATQSEITLNASIALDAGWPYPLPVIKADAYITYKCLHTVGAYTVYTLSTVDEADMYLGVDHVDNPIRHGVGMALLNAAGTSLQAIYPGKNDLVGYTELFKKLESTTAIYRMAIMSYDESIISLAIANVNLTNKWREVITCREMPDYFTVLTCMATVHANPLTPTVFDIIKSDDATFTMAQLGDTLQYLGNNYTIKAIQTNSTLQLNQNLGAAQLVPSTAVIIHYPTIAEYASYYKFIGQTYKNRRVVHVVPDKFLDDLGVTNYGYYRAAIIAGLKAGLLPHQPITNYTVLGIASSPNIFSETQLDLIAEGGNFIFVNSTIRHQLTTDMSTIKTREISINENLDYISYGLLEVVEPYIGKYNIHPGVLAQLSTDIEGFLYSMTASSTVSAGPRILSYQIIKLEQDPTQEDKIIMQIRVFLPSPLNYEDITIIA